MKIQQLPMGARFIYQGEEFVKTGPMFGSGKRGQQMIPRYATLTLPDAPNAVGARQESETRTRVQEAFDAFYAECLNFMPADLRPKLSEARERFLKAL